MLVPWLLVSFHLLWQVACCVFFGGSWAFVVLALFLLAGLAAWDLPRLLRALS